MKKRLLLSLLGVSGLLFMGMTWLIFFGTHQQLSHRRTAYLAIVETIVTRYTAEVNQLEQKVYAALAEEELQEFFTAAANGTPTQYRVSFFDPFLINFFLITATDDIAYAYSPLTPLSSALPVQAGITLLDQETLAITAWMPQPASTARAVFLFDLRKLFKEIFKHTFTHFTEQEFSVYRYAFIYAIRPMSTKATYLSIIETLVDKNYEHYASTFYEKHTADSSKLVGKKLANGLLIGIFYKNAWGNIPLLSWVILSACLLSMLSLAGYIVFMQQPTNIISFYPPWRLWSYGRARSAAAVPILPPAAVKAPSKKPLDTELVSLVESLAPAAPQPPPALINTPTLPPVAKLTYRTVINQLKTESKIFFTPKNKHAKLNALRQLTGRTFTFMLVLEKPQARAAWRATEFHGVDFNTAAQLCIDENEPLFKRFLAKDKAVFIRNAKQDFLKNRLTPERFQHLNMIENLLIIPLKPTGQKNLKTVLLFGPLPAAV